MKKRFLAIILMIIMLIQTQALALAAPHSEVLISDEADASSQSISTMSLNEETPSSIVNFELQLSFDLPISTQGIELLKNAFMVTLHRTDVEEVEHVHVFLNSISGNVITYQAEDVAPGEYMLKLEAEYYFQDFEQSVTITEGAKTTLMFSTSFASYRGDGKTSPGVFAIGDLNGDGQIDSLDSAVLLESIGQTAFTINGKEQVANGDFKDVYDINKDGTLDIGDLGILVYNMDQVKREALPIETVLKTSVSIEESQSAAIPQGERKLDSIMDDAEENVVLAPENIAEAISEENPVAFEMDFASAPEVGGIIISAPADKGPTAATIMVEAIDPKNPDGAGKMIEVTLVDEDEAPVAQQGIFSMKAMAADEGTVIDSSKAVATRKADGTIVINLGTQVAIKKVTIIVTATASSTNLTEIAKVEFLNDMESRIPEPELNIPKNIVASGEGDSFTVRWDAEANVTGYEVAVSAIDKAGKTYSERTYKAGVNQIKIESFTGGEKNKVTPLWTYYIRVRSLNGSWSSPYSYKISHLQLAAGAPDAPDNVKVNGKFRQLDVSWKDMTGTEKYSLEYRESGTEEYTVINDIERNAYQITGLKDNTAYQVRVRGWNTDSKGKLRSGPYSLPAVGKTTVEIPQFPKYGMITRDEITSVSCFANANPGGPGGIDLSKYEDGMFSQEYVIDGDYTTYMHTNKGYPHGVIVTFDEEKEISEIIMTTRLEDAYRDGTGYSQVIVEVWDANNAYRKIERPVVSVASLHPTSKNTMKFALAYPVKAKKIKFSLSKYGAGVVTISEINFFKYDSLESDVNALYADEMHVTLKEDVTLDRIAALEERAKIKDPNFDEYHPKKALLEAELAYARELLLNKNKISDVISIKPDVTKANTNGCGFASGLSGYQPLGYVAPSGSTVNVYVGQKNRRVGDGTSVRLVFTQYHAESSAWSSGEIALYQGKNVITIPEVSSLDFEKGGSLYIVHTNPAGLVSEPVEVRVSGATKIPMLDLYRNIGADRFTIDEVAWKSTIRTYVENLVDYTSKLKSMHDAQKTTYAYGNGSNCFLNSTEISLDNLLISVPASQILAGLGGASASIDTLTNKMYNTAVAMNQMIELFYKERGFNPSLSNGTQGIPTARFNIRYHRMFAGAFMYAGGLHLGIEWDSVPSLAKGNPIVTDENGKRIGGNMFGWGIAHEMGHNADPGGITYAEVTNNIWSQFEKTWDTAGTSRVPYDKVYEHVTSNTTGKAGNVFAQLGMYWQLHLAYDKNYTNYNYYTDGFTAENYANMYANEFFARYYAIRRESAKAPATSIKIANGTTDQNIMRLSCAAAERDLTDFFRAWGMDVDATTAAYAAQFPKEERKIQYLNDAAREYTLANPDVESGKMTSTTVDASLVQGTGENARKVTLTISLPTEARMDAVLGYEIIRNGKPAAFIQPAKTEEGYADVTVYEDTVQTINNRVVAYEVVAYDKYLNTTEKTSLAPIKIRHEGILPTSGWTVTSTNAVSTSGVLTVYDGIDVKEGKDVVVGNTYTDATTGASVVYSADMDVKYLDKDTGEALRSYSTAERIYNGDKNVGFEGITASANDTAQITIDLGGRQEITALAFLGGSTIPWKFMLEYSNNGGASFTRIQGFEAGTTSDGYPVLYFANGKNIKAYTATTIRISSPSKVRTIGIKDIKLLSPSGDNVDIGVSTVDEATGIETWNTQDAIGLLKEDYILDNATGEKIPAGSFIVTGKYTGNAAYNVVKLYNQNHEMFNDSTENKLGSILNGYQVFFADMPDSGSIVNVKDGFWLYWLEPLSGANSGKFGLPGAAADGSDIVVELPTKVYAELYRVDDAITLAGERLVSDTFTVDVPTNLPQITLQNAD